MGITCFGIDTYRLADGGSISEFSSRFDQVSQEGYHKLVLELCPCHCRAYQPLHQ